MSPQPHLFRSPVLPPPFPIVDVHVHLGASDTGEIFYPNLTGAHYAALMRESNIDRAFAFAPLRNDGYAQANASLRAWCDQADEPIRPFARLGGRRQPVTVAQAWMVKKKLAGLGRARPLDLDSLDDLESFAGVKMLPQLDGLVDDAVFDRIAALELPVLVHGGTHSPPGFIARKIVPRVRGPVIVAHCGCFPCDDRAFFDAVALAGRHERVYLDTSGVTVSEFLRHAAQHTPDKLLFGSDAPLSHPLVAWQHLASVVHDDSLLERIGGATARAVLDCRIGRRGVRMSALPKRENNGRFDPDAPHDQHMQPDIGERDR